MTAKKHKPTPLQTVARELVRRYGPRTPAMVWVRQSQELGRHVDGDGALAQFDSIHAELLKDPELVFNEGTGRFGLAEDADDLKR